MRVDSEMRALRERISLLEAEIERMREAEHTLRGQMASRIEVAWFHAALDQRGVPREDEQARLLTLTQRLDWLAGKRG